MFHGINFLLESEMVLFVILQIVSIGISVLTVLLTEVFLKKLIPTNQTRSVIMVLLYVILTIPLTGWLGIIKEKVENDRRHSCLSIPNSTFVPASFTSNNCYIDVIIDGKPKIIRIESYFIEDKENDAK
jgi:energy-coupling factor transporter transmembrane protein EcfT